MKVIEKMGLLLFLIGLAGAEVNREEGLIFWLALIVVLIGVWMFVGKDLKRE